MITQLPVFDRIVIQPSEAPASELPEPEPTVADLLVIETGDDDTVETRIEAALRLAAHEQTHRELMALRRHHAIAAEPDEESTTEWRTAA
ncbi:hypothetical protein ACFS2C_28105 [Prauserella oleivorans]|uniref:Uncharacterized protein n=1 Tax=Prauserella oleivorans TaxID=1478153 RepID=A0ABW5WLD8_9PSEU